MYHRPIATDDATYCGIYVLHQLSLLLAYFLWFFSFPAFLCDQSSAVQWACIQPIAVGVVLAELVFILLFLRPFIAFEVATIVVDTAHLTAWNLAFLRMDIKFSVQD